MNLINYTDKTYTNQLKKLYEVLDSHGLGVRIAHIIRAESAWKGKALSSEGYRRLMAKYLYDRLDNDIRKLNREDKKTFSSEYIEKITKTLSPRSFNYRYLEYEAYHLKRAFYELFEKRGISNGLYKKIGDCFLRVIEEEAANKSIYEQYDLLVKKINSLSKNND